MTKVFRNVLLGLILLAVSAGPAFSQSRIGTVDLRKVFDNYWKRKQADAAIKERAADMEKEHTKMINDWKKAKDDYQALLTSANDQAVSGEERDKRKKSAEDKLKAIKATEETISQYEKTARTTIEEQLKRMRENILNEIKAVVNGQAQAGSFNMVFDTAAETVNNTPIILFSSGKDNDLTDAVLTRLNATAPADTEKKK